MKKFISIICWYHKQIFSFTKEQNYHMLPLKAMKEEWYECTIFSIDASVKIEDDPNFIKWIKVIYYKNIFQYLKFLLKNRNELIYSNTLTIKTLLVWLIWKRTVFIPHDLIFWWNKLKSIVIHFFYKFFTKIRLNNNKEVEAVNKIKKNLWVRIPLVVSWDFFNPDFQFWNDNIFVSLWNLTKKKHPEVILEALKIVKDKWYDFKLKVVWEDRLKEYCDYSYEDLLNKHWLRNYVDVIWFVPHTDLSKVCKWACCYLNASTQEWLCLAVYESTLMWMATILPNILSFDWVFGDNGLYYKSWDVNDFANKIMYFLDHRDDFIEKIKNNQQKILKEYNYDTIKQQLKDLFLSL